MDISTSYIRILDGVEAILSHFEEEGLQQCLATNKSTPEAERILAHLEIEGYFDLIVGYDDVSRPKPSPEMVLLTLEAIGAKPNETVLVEDSPTGLTAGKEAGVHTVAITTGFHDATNLAVLKPDYIINEIRDLMRIVFV